MLGDLDITNYMISKSLIVFEIRALNFKLYFKKSYSF